MHKRVQNLSKEVKDIKRATMFNTIMMAVFVIWSFVKPEVSGDNIANAGNVATNLSISGDGSDSLVEARRRGYFTAKEYAEFQGINLDTVYRRLDAGLIQGAEKVNKRWRLPCN